MSGNCAPIIHYMRYWSLESIQAYCLRKRWTLEIL